MSTDETPIAPVVLLMFNRPGTTARVLDAIRGARPRTLLVVSDGPRGDRPGEDALVRACRALVARVDWPCDVRTNYADRNLGCRDRVSSGLSWAFGEVDRAIVLEDDCLPSPLFFRYCSHLLDRHRNDRDVGALLGTNPAAGREQDLDRLDYFASHHFLAWGWATWADRWTPTYDVSLRRLYRARSLVRLLRIHGVNAFYWLYILSRVKYRHLDTWDHQWAFANWISERVCLVPTQNLVRNVGFDADATHTRAVQRRHFLADLPLCSLEQYDLPRMKWQTRARFDGWFTSLFVRASLSGAVERLRRLGGFGRGGPSGSR